jgi:hypothetical protein
VTTTAAWRSPATGYVAKFDTTKSGSSSLLYSTFINTGNLGGAYIYSLAVDANGNAYLGGTDGMYSGFSVTSGALQSSAGSYPNYNPTLTVLKPDGSLLYGTFLGGSGSTSESIAALALDSSNNIYITGRTASTSLATSGAFQATAPSSLSNYILKLTALPVPIISSLSVSSGPGDEEVTINGANFASTEGTVTFNGTTATIESWGSTEIIVDVPTSLSAGTVEISVNASLEGSNLVAFTVEGPPTISGLSLPQGPQRMGFVISGSNFGIPQPYGATVIIGGFAMTVVSWNDTSITVQMPTTVSNGSQSVVVTVGGHASSGASFEVDSSFCDPTAGCSF